MPHIDINIAFTIGDHDLVLVQQKLFAGERAARPDVWKLPGGNTNLSEVSLQQAACRLLGETIALYTFVRCFEFLTLIDNPRGDKFAPVTSIVFAATRPDDKHCPWIAGTKRGHLISRDKEDELFVRAFPLWELTGMNIDPDHLLAIRELAARKNIPIS